MFQLGIYEQLINRLIAEKLGVLNQNQFFIMKNPIDKEEAAMILSQYLEHVIRVALGSLTGDGSVEKQIILANTIIKTIAKELEDSDFDEDLIEAEAKILTAVFKKLDAPFSDIEKHLHKITPYTRLSHSELFTGHAGLSLESEIKKEILSSDKIYFLVSFIKWTGIRIFEKELKEFTNSGRELKVITTSYMGATDEKAISFLSKLKNTEIKISYNTEHERLHAKAYLFLRDTGFHTGYIGSSNMSRSALTTGLEWNLKVTTKEISHIIDKFQKTFETYWVNREFELFDGDFDIPKLRSALKNEKHASRDAHITFFDIKPYTFQEEILEKLTVERILHNRYRNLIVAATGTGKTMISAFDFKRFQSEQPTSRLLYVAHRKEILQQAQNTFRAVLRDQNFGELWVDGLEPISYNVVFASIQTLNSRLQDWQVSPTFYDYVIMDEVHHITAESYRPIVDYFTPQILLGLTATPERMDREDILKDFCNTIAAEIRLPEALNRKLLCPFQYFGISDSVDLRNVTWSGGKYQISELTSIYTKNDIRVGEIISNLDKYLLDPFDVRALGFCASVEHAKFMATKFSLKGFKAAYLTSANSKDRDKLRGMLFRKEVNYLFVVDIFNEGVDIPEIDTVLFLRPTESLTIFLQQLGRGLRLADGKECLTVLDFVGNSRKEYDFEHKFRSLIGKTITSVKHEIENDFPHLPLGCSIVLEKKAKEIILENIISATSFSRNQLLNKIQNFKHQVDLPLSLKNFTTIHQIPLHFIYRHGSWNRLCVEAGQQNEFNSLNEKEAVRAIGKKWLATRSTDYFYFILKLARIEFKINWSQLTEVEKQLCLLLYYDFWQKPDIFESMEESILAIGKNKIIVSEIIEVIEIIIDRIDFLEHDIKLPYTQPLKLHSRYTRDQILAAFEINTFEKLGGAFGLGVVSVPNKNTEILFVTLKKSEKEYSPTTLYQDFAISDSLFHWQTQNSARSDRGRGLGYIQHQKNNKTILLFVREQNDNEYKNSMGFVFLGEVIFKSYSGTRPMNITWQLKVPMPPYLWHDTAKMAIG